MGVINVALGKEIVVDHVSSDAFRLLVDGDRNSCIVRDTGYDVRWQVDLGDLYTIFDVRVKPTVDYFHQKRVFLIF